MQLLLEDTRSSVAEPSVSTGADHSAWWLGESRASSLTSGVAPTGKAEALIVKLSNMSMEMPVKIKISALRSKSLD